MTGTYLENISETLNGQNVIYLLFELQVVTLQQKLQELEASSGSSPSHESPENGGTDTEVKVTSDAQKICDEVEKLKTEVCFYG